MTNPPFKGVTEVPVLLLELEVFFKFIDIDALLLPVSRGEVNP